LRDYPDRAIPLQKNRFNLLHDYRHREIDDADRERRALNFSGGVTI
jgi:hypothetical protein